MQNIYSKSILSHISHANEIHNSDSHKTIVEEIKNGSKQGHWIWWAFPCLTKIRGRRAELKFKTMIEVKCYLK